VINFNQENANVSQDFSIPHSWDQQRFLRIWTKLVSNSHKMWETQRSPTKWWMMKPEKTTKRLARN